MTFKRTSCLMGGGGLCCGEEQEIPELQGLRLGTAMERHSLPLILQPTFRNHSSQRLWKCLSPPPTPLRMGALPLTLCFSIADGPGRDWHLGLTLTPLCKLVSGVGWCFVCTVFPGLEPCISFLSLPALWGTPGLLLSALTYRGPWARASWPFCLGPPPWHSRSLALSTWPALRVLDCGQGRTCLGRPRAALELKVLFPFSSGFHLPLLFSDFFARDSRMETWWSPG